jgi:O-methyltransferase
VINLLELSTLAGMSPKGNFLELGVYKGGSAWCLYQVSESQQRKLFLFDTFTGLPYEGPQQQLSAGAFSDTDRNTVQSWMPNAKIFPGVFPNTLFATDEVKDLAFVHVDCDLLGGCTAALEKLWPLMVAGGIMAFDDWGFESIHKPVESRFGKENIKFTPIKIPYVVKELT